MRSGQSDFMRDLGIIEWGEIPAFAGMTETGNYFASGDFQIEIERKNIAIMIAVQIAQSGQNTQTIISCEMTYPLKHIPPKASPVRIFASIADFRI